MTAPRVLWLWLALAGMGCGADSVTPTSPTTTAEAISTLFSGVIQVKGTRFYSYSTSAQGSATAMLASLTSGSGAPMTHRLDLGIGIPAGTGCAVQAVATVSPSLVPQLTFAAPVGTYCVSVTDAEGLPASMNFAIRIVHP